MFFSSVIYVQQIDIKCQNAPKMRLRLVDGVYSKDGSQYCRREIEEDGGNVSGKVACSYIVNDSIDTIGASQMGQIDKHMVECGKKAVMMFQKIACQCIEGAPIAPERSKERCKIVAQQSSVGRGDVGPVVEGWQQQNE